MIGKMLFFPRYSILKLVRLTFRSFFEYGGPTTAAAVSYFTLIMLFPAFLLLIGLGEVLIRNHAQAREIAVKVVALFPQEETRVFILTNIDKLVVQPSWGTILSNVLIYLWAGLWVFHIMEEALDKAWNVEGRASFWERKRMNLRMIVVATACIIGSALVTALAHLWRLQIDFTTNKFWDSTIEVALLTLIAYLLSTVMITSIYKIMPNALVPFSEALSGGLITAFIWQVVNAVFVWSLPFFDYQRVYGSLGAVVVIVVWVYVSSWIVLIGAHLTYHIHRVSEEMAERQLQPPGNGDRPPRRDR